MQESDKKPTENERPRGRHAAAKIEESAATAPDPVEALKPSTSEETETEDALSEDYDLLGDESEIPLRRQK